MRTRKNNVLYMPCTFCINFSAKFQNAEQLCCNILSAEQSLSCENYSQVRAYIIILQLQKSNSKLIPLPPGLYLLQTMLELCIIQFVASQVSMTYIYRDKEIRSYQSEVE